MSSRPNARKGDSGGGGGGGNKYNFDHENWSMPDDNLKQWRRNFYGPATEKVRPCLASFTALNPTCFRRSRGAACGGKWWRSRAAFPCFIT